MMKKINTIAEQAVLASIRERQLIHFQIWREYCHYLINIPGSEKLLPLKEFIHRHRLLPRYATKWDFGPLNKTALNALVTHISNAVCNFWRQND